MSSTCSILVLDSDHFLQEMIETGVRLSKPEWTVISAFDPGRALRALDEFSVDAVVTEIEFPKRAAERAVVEMLRTLDHEFPRLPVFILTAVPVSDFKHVSTADYIPKPPDMDYLIGKLHRAIRISRRGTLRSISLEGLLQVLELERRTCTVVVGSGSRIGRLYIRDGRLIHARTAEQTSKQAAFTILSWPNPGLEVHESCHAEVSISAGLTPLLMEWCVGTDQEADK